MRSAVFLPMPGTLAKSPVSWCITHSASAAGDNADSTARASFGPTPLTLMSTRNRPRSANERKPNSVMASSRATKWVNSSTSASASASAAVGTSTS